MKTIEVREIVVSYKKKTKQYKEVRDPEDVHKFLKGLLTTNAKEHFIAIYLDGQHSIISYSVCCIGTATACPIAPREVFQPAIACGAVSIVIAHNHPGGGLKFSKEDLEVTERMLQAGKILGIRLIDHILFTDEKYLSFKEAHGI